MRRYYYITHRHQLPEESPQSYLQLSKELQIQITKFRKNHLLREEAHGIPDVSFIKKRTLQKPIILTSGIFIYEEDGVCYEFFSHNEIGHIADKWSEKVLVGVLPKEVSLDRRSDSAISGYELTAEKFAEYVVKYKNNCEDLSAIMKSYLTLCRALTDYYAKLNEDKKRKQVVRDMKNMDWLEKHFGEK